MSKDGIKEIFVTSEKNAKRLNGSNLTSNASNVVIPYVETNQNASRNASRNTGRNAGRNSADASNAYADYVGNPKSKNAVIDQGKLSPSAQNALKKKIGQLLGNKNSKKNT